MGTVWSCRIAIHADGIAIAQGHDQRTHQLAASQILPVGLGDAPGAGSASPSKRQRHLIERLEQQPELVVALLVDAVVEAALADLGHRFAHQRIGLANQLATKYIATATASTVTTASTTSA
jgi:hypothetical protein